MFNFNNVFDLPKFTALQCFEAVNLETVRTVTKKEEKERKKGWNRGSLGLRLTVPPNKHNNANLLRPNIVRIYNTSIATVHKLH